MAANGSGGFAERRGEEEEEHGDGSGKSMSSVSAVSTVKEGEELDWTSKLPDELLVEVLSFLTLKEAVRTSILSSKRRNLWKSSDLVLDFDAMEELLAIYKGPRGNKWPALVEKRRWFKNWVNGVVRQLQEHNSFIKLKKFRVAFNFTDKCDSEGDIDRWVEFAVSKRVESLDLRFDVTFTGSPKYYVFPEDCYNHIKTPVGVSDIKSLRSLRLRCVEVRGEVIEHFISNCPLLEELAVAGTIFLKKLRVVGSSQLPLRLKCLEVRRCMSLESLEIDHAPCLMRLIYDDCRSLKEFRVGKCPCLVDLILGLGAAPYDHVFKALYGCTSQLEHLLVKTSAVGKVVRDVPEHTRLERMTIEVKGGSNYSLLELVQFINACPRLHTLQVRMHTLKCDGCGTSDLSAVVKMRRESIKVVEIIGFRSFEMDRELVEYVMEYFVGLERIVFDRSVGIPIPSENSIFGGKFSKPCSEEEAEEAEKLALAFKSRAPPTVEFVVL